MERAYVINSENGMDEFSTTSKIRAAYLIDGEIKKMMIDPVDYGFSMANIGDLEGGDASLNAKILEDILSGRIKGPMRDSAVFNAAAAIVTGKVADRLEDGIELAVGSIDSGRALVKLNDLIDCSNRK